MQFLCAVVLTLSVSGSLQHDGPHHGVDYNGRIDEHRVGVPGAADPSFTVDSIGPGIGAGGQGQIGGFDGFIDGNSGFVDGRAGFLDNGGGHGFINAGPDFRQAGSGGFSSREGTLRSGVSGLINNRGNVFPGRIGYSTGLGYDGISDVNGYGVNRYDVSGYGVNGYDVNGYNNDRVGFTSSFNVGGQFVDFGMDRQYDGVGINEFGTNDGLTSGLGVSSVDRGFGSGVIAGDRIRTDADGRKLGRASEFRGINGAGYRDLDRGYDGRKLYGFIPGQPFSGVGRGGVGGTPITGSDIGGVGATSYADRLIGVKSRPTTHHSKLTTVVRPIVRPVIRPVIRPLIKRVVRPIIKRPVVRPVVRRIINRGVRPIITRPTVRPIARSVARPIRERPDTVTGGVGGDYPGYPGFRTGGIAPGWGKQYYQPSYKRSQYY